MIACPRCGHPNEDDARYCSNCALALADAGQPASETRKTVTIMFMDAVGSTGVGEQADPETLRRVMMRYFDEIRATVERHGGTVEKYIGDAVMAVFGVPVVHEDDALRAVRAAAEIRDRLAELEQRLRVERGMVIEWRTGINTGEVVAGDAGTGQRFVTGDAVNVAARLEQLASAGEILIGAETQGLLRDAASVEPLPPITVKGKQKPLDAYRLLSVEAVADMPGRQLDAPMVGRLRPRRLLADAFDQVTSDRVCHLFTVLGAAGVGKSRLVREFLAELGGSSRVLRGRCLSYGEGITYWPIAEAIRQVAGVVEDDTDDQVLAKLGRLIADPQARPKAARALGELIGRSDGAAGQEETFWAVRTLFDSLARETPVVLVLDDLHWAAPTLLDLVEYLAEWTSDAPLLLICVARQELLEARPNWAGGKPYSTTLTLEPLSDEESRQLVVGLLGQANVDPAFEQRIATAAEGNPLFVEELIGMLIDTGRIVPSDKGGWSVSGELEQIDVPPTIHALLSARLDQLPSAERLVLERGAVEGKVFHRAAVTELMPDPLRDTVPVQLRSLARKELVRPDRPDFAGDEAFRFRHLLLRDAAYNALPKETRADLHARFAGWLRRVAADHISEYEELLGYHDEQAYRYRSELGLNDDETARLGRAASEHLAMAGERALDRGDIAAASKLLGSAADLRLAGDPLGRRLRAELAEALARSGDVRAADEMLREVITSATRAGDAPGQAYAEIVQVDVVSSLSTASMEQNIADCERLRRVLEQHGDRRGADKATYELARNHFFAGHAKVAEDILVEAMATAHSPAAGARFAAWLTAVLLWGPTPVAMAERRVTALLEGAANRNVEAYAEAALGMLCALTGVFDEAREHIQRAIAITEELGLLVSTLGYEGNFLGLAETLSENYDEAERVMVHSLNGLTQAGERGFGSTVAGGLAHLYVLMGRYDEAERHGLLAQEMATGDDIDAQARGFRARARVAAARGEHETALDLINSAVAIVDATDYSGLAGETYADLAEVLLAAGEVDAARRAFATARQSFEAKGVTVELPRIDHRLARISGQS